jgi:putative tricarboxylic transport membrane protein
VPAGGSEVPTFLSYALEKKLSPHADEFGEGAIEGVAGPEAANNAAIAGTLVPLLTLGIPTSAVGAILLSAFQNYGIQPGPSLFTNHGPLVWTLIASLLIGNCILLILNLPLVRLWVKILLIPRPYLYAGIICFALAAIWGASNSTVDLILMFAIGLLAYVMRSFSFPVVPVIIGMILGPMAETHLRRSLAVSQGDLSGLVSTQTSACLLGLAAAICLYSLFRMARTWTSVPAARPESANVH